MPSSPTSAVWRSVSGANAPASSAAAAAGASTPAANSRTVRRTRSGSSLTPESIACPVLGTEYSVLRIPRARALVEVRGAQAEVGEVALHDVDEDLAHVAVLRRLDPQLAVALLVGRAVAAEDVDGVGIPLVHGRLHR